LEIKKSVNLDAFIEEMENNECVCLDQPKDPPPHLVILRGYTPQGFAGQAVHIHVRYSGDHDELYFRDYLLSHPETAAEYAALKLSLKDRFEHDRDGYTEAKGEFIRRITQLARREFSGRYLPEYLNL